MIMAHRREHAVGGVYHHVSGSQRNLVLYNLYISGHVVSGGDVMYKQILIDGFRY